MKDTTANRELLERLEERCLRTPYCLRILEREGCIGLSLVTRSTAPEYTPDLYLYDDTSYTGGFRIGIQTTGYGTMDIGATFAVAQGLTTAAKLAKALCEEIRAAGYEVYRA